MELHFQKQQIQQKDCILDRNTVTTATSNGNKKRKFVGVRQRPSGKWVAEIKNTTQKIRMWLGTFDTAEEAAQAYDEAACLLRGSNTRTNFINNPHRHHYCNPALSLKIRNLLNQKRNRNKMTSPTTTPPPPPPPVASTKKCNGSSSSTSIISSVTQENSSAATNYNYNQISNQDQAQKIKLFDDAYKPDLSYFMGGFEMGSSSSPPHLQNHQIFDDRILVGEEQQEQEQEKGFDEISTRESELINNETHHQIQDFEHMKVERQISASLYAMNGVNEYWENVHDCNDSFWDLPMLYQMFCPS